MKRKFLHWWMNRMRTVISRMYSPSIFSSVHFHKYLLFYCIRRNYIRLTGLEAVHFWMGITEYFVNAAHIPKIARAITTKYSLDPKNRTSSSKLKLAHWLVLINIFCSWKKEQIITLAKVVNAHLLIRNFRLKQQSKLSHTYYRIFILDRHSSRQ